MDREKVIKGLEYCIADDYCDDCPYTDDCFEIDDKPYGEQLMRDALALLKEQEDMGKELTDAIELVHKKNARIIELTDRLKEQEAVEPSVSSVEQRCGNCNKVIEMDGWKACPWCGKRIDWKGWWKKNGTRNQDT